MQKPQPSMLPTEPSRLGNLSSSPVSLLAERTQTSEMASFFGGHVMTSLCLPVSLSGVSYAACTNTPCKQVRGRLNTHCQAGGGA